MAPKRKASLALEKIVPKIQFGNAGSQHNNTGDGRQFIAHTMFINESRNVLKQDELDCLRELRATDPRDEKSRIEDTKGGLLADSYEWILENNEFKVWLDDDRSGLFWINGSPGKGKTMLLCGVIDALSQLTTEAGLPAFFLCQHDDSRLSDAAEVLRGLIYLLAIQRQSTLKILQERYSAPGRNLSKHHDPFFALSTILRDILKIPTREPVYLIVDAIDECQKEDLIKLLGFIRSTLAIPSTCVKWIVTSRHNYEIQEQMSLIQHRGTLDLDSTEALICAAVNKFIDHKVTELERLKSYTPELTEAVREYLCCNAQGTFLWVALVCESLSKTMPWATRSELRSELHNFPAGLEALYEKMMKEMFTSKEADLGICMKILAIAMVAYRPVTLAELPNLVDLGEEISNNPGWLNHIIGLCGSFLIVRQDTVYFVHESAKAYLTEHAEERIFAPSRSHVHYGIHSRSLQTLTKTLKRDMYNLEHPGSPIHHIIANNPDPLAAIRYPCLYWVDHLAAIDRNSEDYLSAMHSSQDIHDFLQGCFLYWLEALSLCKSMTKGMAGLATLEMVLGYLPDEPQLLGLVKDARRFVLHHRGLIENAPLQAYASALVFSPTHSLVRTTFVSYEPEWIEANPAVEEDWSPCILMLQEHRDSVNSVVYSYDNKYLGSASTDHSIRIWDAATGKHLQTLVGHDGAVYSVAFSPNDSQWIVSAAGDGSIKIWEAITGRCIQTFEGHSDNVRSVAFSLNGQRIASASSDRTIKIWDAETGKCLKTLHGHIDRVNSVCFLPEDECIVSASSDMTIKVWDVVAGTCKMTLGGHSDWVNSVCCSRDGRRFISASSDRTIKIWASTGNCMKTLMGHTSWINSVVLSPDNKRLASASTDRTVKIWDVETGRCMKTLKGYDDAVNSVAFPYDTEMLASAWNDRSIRIWETSSDECTKKTDSHTNWVTTILFSSDHKLLASVSDDQKVKIWDVNTRKCVYTLEGHSDSPSSIAFSHNGVYLASATCDRKIEVLNTVTKQVKTLEGHDDRATSVVFSHNDQHLASIDNQNLKIWLVGDGRAIRTLEGHLDYVTSIAFSTDDRYLASSSNDRTCRIWDLQTGCCIYMLEGHNDCVSSVSFSDDGKCIVSTSGDKTIKVWDAASGELIKTLSGHVDWVITAAFSHDGSYLVSTSIDSTVRLWNATTGECLQCIHVEAPVNLISFDSANSYIITERGCIILKSFATIDSTNANEQVWHGYGLSSNKSWVTYDGQNMLWLPFEYRVICSAVVGSLVAVGCSSGKVLILRCSKATPPILRRITEDIIGLSHERMEDSWQTSISPNNGVATGNTLFNSTLDERPCTEDPDIEESDTLGRTKLHLAVLRGDEQAVKQMLEERVVRRCTRDKYHRTALFYAVKNGKKTMSLLLAKEWNVPDHVVIDHVVNQKKEYRAKALFGAIKRGNKDEVGFLIEIGADIEAKGYGDWPGRKGTALHEAAWYGTLDMLKLMLDNGADKYARDMAGWTPSQRPNWSRTAEISRFLS